MFFPFPKGGIFRCHVSFRVLQWTYKNNGWKTTVLIGCHHSEHLPKQKITSESQGLGTIHQPWDVFERWDRSRSRWILVGKQKTWNNYLRRIIPFIVSIDSSHGDRKSRKFLGFFLFQMGRTLWPPMHGGYIRNGLPLCAFYTRGPDPPSIAGRLPPEFGWLENNETTLGTGGNSKIF